MADLFGLLQDLGERIASKGDSSGSTQADEEDPVEARFRSVLPNLLKGYFLPSKVKEREVTAVLKLLCHTVKHYPGVFYYGKAQAVLPIMARIIPFFAEPAVSTRHGVFFETLSALLSLLRTGDRETYRNIFVGATLLLEDLASVASFFAMPSGFTDITAVSIECFSDAFSVLFVMGDDSAGTLFCELPSCWKPPNSAGLLIDVMGEARWQSLAEYMIKLLCRCLVEGALHVEGLLTLPFLHAVGKLLCYGDSSLQKACFEFFCLVTSMVDVEAIPSEKIILSITSILCLDEKSSAFRNVLYDSAMGSCLSALLAASHKEVVEGIVHAFVDVLPHAVMNTESRELKVALCIGFEQIVKHCPPHVWKLDSIFKLLFISEISSYVFNCFKLAFDILGLMEPTVDTIVYDPRTLILTSPQEKRDAYIADEQVSNDVCLIGEKRLSTGSHDTKLKRRKLGTNGIFETDLSISTTHNLGDEHANMHACDGTLTELCLRCISGAQQTFKIKKTSSFNYFSTSEQEKMICTNHVKNELLRIISVLEPSAAESSHLQAEGMLSALKVLTQLFVNHPRTAYCELLSKQIQLWIPWISCKGKGALTVYLLSIFFEVLGSLLSSDTRLDFDITNATTQILEILQLPWSAFHDSMRNILQKAKSQAVTMASNIYMKLKVLSMDQVLDNALKDEDPFIRAEAVSKLPTFASYSTADRKEKFCLHLVDLVTDKAYGVREAVAQVIGQMACLCTDVLCSTRHGISWICPQCEVLKKPLAETSLGPGDKTKTSFLAFTTLQRLFLQFVFEEPSQQLQVACIRNMPWFLQHASKSDLASIKEEWLKCIETFPLHHDRSLREAFGSQIQYFFSRHVLQGLFGGDDDKDDTNKELEILGKLRHALVVAEDPDVLETLLETISEVVQVAGGRRQLFFFSFVLLLEQLDSKYVSVQVTSVSLLQKCSSLQCSEGDSGRLHLMVDSVRDELFEYLSSRLVTRPIMIKEFADAVMGMEIVDLIKQMIPVVLPKLVIQQQHSNEASNILHELARQLKTELPFLLLEWCHKVLSVLLLKADGKELMSALQFYESQTGSDTHEIFSAVLPALLDELIWFLGDTGGESALRRSARVSPMIQEVASIVTQSDDLPGFLREHFVGLLNSIDQKLLQSEHLSSQKRALRCLEWLIKMIGSHLSSFVPKIMVLLTRASREISIQSEGLHVWLSFVRQLAEVSPSSLKSVASQIVVAMMPCLEEQQEGKNCHLSAVVEVLEELIIKNRNILDDQAGELPILPSFPTLANVNAVLQEARGLTSLCDQLKRAVDGLSHESIGIRLMTSSELKKLIKDKRKGIISMLLGEAISDTNILSHLVTSLLHGCAEESRTSISQRFKLICAECLGELGAIEPVKLHINLRARSKIECTDDDLFFELIHEHLAKILRAASDTAVQDAAALAIQELLKLSGCKVALQAGTHTSASGIYKSKHSPHCVEKVDSKSQSGDDPSDTAGLCEKGEKLWSRFTDDVKEIIIPCLTSKYLLKNANAAIPSGPIFRPGMSFRRWMYLWVRRLVSQSTGFRSLIFNACRGVIRHDMGTAIYLLPYLVLNVVCNGSCEARSSVTDEILAVLAEAGSVTSEAAIMRTEGASGGSNQNCSGPNEVSIQAIFTLLDNLGQWLDECKHDIAFCQTLQSIPAGKGIRSNASLEVKKDTSQLVLQCNHVSQLLAAIPKTALASASFRCQAYARAFLYFESHVRSTSGALNPAAELCGTFSDEDVTFLLEIYSGLDEPDGHFGLSRLRRSISLQDQILINEKAGNWAETLTCYEQALQIEPNSVSRHCGVLDCLLNMGHLQAMVTHVDGLISRFKDHKQEWSMRGVQAAWRLGQWDLLDEYLSGAEGDNSVCATADSNVAFDINLAKILQALKKRDWYIFAEQIMQARIALLAPLAAAGMESYTRAYPFVVKLHMLRELEDFQALFVDDSELENSGEMCLQNLDGKILKMVEDWDDRLKITQPSLWTREPILALRRLVLSASCMQLEVGACWLQYAKLCRAAGHYETANRAILQAQSSGAPNAHMELAKLLWDTNKTHRAIAELQQALSKVPVQFLGSAAAALGGFLNIPSQTVANQEIVATQSRRDELSDVARTLLLLARWVHCTGQKQKEDVLNIYSRVRELQPKWEKGFFFLAKYCDDLLVDARRRQEESQESTLNRDGSSGKRRQGGTTGKASTTDDKHWCDYLPDVILYYAKGLHKGHRHLFKALPRLLTLWFEFGSSYHGEALSSNATLKAVHGRVMGVMRGCLKDLPTYQWLTALSQLVSRVCHQNDEIVRLVKRIITAVLQSYTQQALWIMAAVTKSTVAARRQAAAEILQQARNALRQEHERNLFTQFATLIEQLIRLCFHSGPAKAKTLSLSAEFSFLKRMMPVDIIVPAQKTLTVTLPADGETDLSYNPFSAGDISTISGIGEEVEVLASLQRPKKVVFYGNDGMEYPFLCKPKDDLRKDARMMEFTTMINRLLSKDSKSRRRKLYIRTFAVIPLTEDCGMVEWVRHTKGLRHILQDIYVSCGKFDRLKTNPTIKSIYDQNQGKMSDPEMFRTKILPMFPPVFHKWFLNTFTEPATWFQSRVAYAHTTAVWSMVGHIVGLGDRHGENILFDSTTGDCVHVDFSCLFDKGLQLEKPELVPFRLTQNMVDGLGITGYEGIFSRVCEITLSVLRTNRETLMSVLETFIHDPLVEWTKSHKSSGVEVQNPHAQRAISNIEARLQGVVVGVGAAPSLPLSVEGQAHRLIAEAVSVENLGRMYIWWMPWF